MRKSSLQYKIRTHTKESKFLNASKMSTKGEDRGVFTFLPAEALVCIAQFDMNNFRSLMGVCADWNFRLKEGMDKLFKRVENDFLNTYGQYLLFKESYTSTQPINFCDKQGLRVDRAIICEILDQ